MIKAKVELSWISIEKGGKKNIPSGPKYSTVARFEDIKEKWPDEAWSIVLEEISSTEEPRKVNAEMYFLIEENAPISLFYPGSRFDLFEGRLNVANGIIISVY